LKYNFGNILFFLTIKLR